MKERNRNVVKIAEMETRDAQAVLEMMKVFYDSPAVLHDVPEDTLRRNIEACISDNPFIDGFVFWDQDHVAGYGMIAKSFSTEFGGACIWVEDLYLKPEYRGSGIGTQFLSFVEERFRGKAVLLKLEVEECNTKAVKVYEKCGYRELPYMEMIKELT